MKIIIISLLILVNIISCLAQQTDDELWNDYLRKHKKSYSNSTEKAKRKQLFFKRKGLIDQHNEQYKQGLVSYSVSLNKFTDMSPKELENYLGLNSEVIDTSDSSFNLQAPLLMTASPLAKDWRSTNCVSPIKNQGSCGSCYAFATTGAIETQACVKNSNLVILSEQNLVDCSISYGNNGCNGGNMINSYKYIMFNNGSSSAQNYPYTGIVGTCANNINNFSPITSYTKLPVGDESTMRDTVANLGPVSVGVSANLYQFFYYYTGIFDAAECTGTPLDHAVLIVGYGTFEGTDYWIVKNSWGPNWGINGYMYLKRGINLCGVSNLASIPIL